MNTKKLSVYLVDDDKVFTTALTNELEKISGTSIRIFETGEELLKNLAQPPDVVVLDYYLNGTLRQAMNGLQVLKKIKQKEPDTQVIMMSVQDNMEVAVDTIKNGAYDYVIKNDKVFLRAKHVVNNAARAITDKRNLKTYQLWTRIVAGFVLTIILAGVLVELKHSNFGF